MSKYIVKINPMVTSFEVQSCETPVIFTYQTQNENSSLSNIKAGDEFFVCYDTDRIKIKMLLKVLETINDNSAKLTKLVEVASGVEVTNESIVDKLKTHDIVEIPDSEGKILLQNMIESIRR